MRYHEWILMKIKEERTQDERTQDDQCQDNDDYDDFELEMDDGA